MRIEFVKSQLNQPRLFITTYIKAKERRKGKSIILWIIDPLYTYLGRYQIVDTHLEALGFTRIHYDNMVNIYARRVPTSSAVAMASTVYLPGTQGLHWRQARLRAGAYSCMPLPSYIPWNAVRQAGMYNYFENHNHLLPNLFTAAPHTPPLPPISQPTHPPTNTSPPPPPQPLIPALQRNKPMHREPRLVHPVREVRRAGMYTRLNISQPTGVCKDLG
ncbi:uncharacterized protein GGS25DRAFT_427087 [Hypoxylon fragiforme]|uniref:uncharacterized protein n=1 Tax=Hypoxylon fragiforme TaxID=63214 RepID=UPI0020C71605|nr:uncharacterized protein GGS25DRAFT_427087 [Hypoxylon fragiforme]KAI2605350.1 hypothetical protein GGS25DRAFT_427087 [Hypoxylon fragiforme]